MANTGSRKDQQNTSSGHGALGMGGDPSDDPRDLKAGGTGADDDRSAPVGGATGSKVGDQAGGGSGNQVAGVGGDDAVDEFPIELD